MIKFSELSILEMAVLVFITQLIFIWLRTLNLKHVQHNQIILAILSGNGIALAWMISVTIGVSSLLTGELLPIIAHLAGGTIGTYLGMRKLDKHES